MEKNISQLLEELTLLISSWRGDLDKIWQRYSDEVAKSAGSLPPLLKQQVQTMLASVQVSRSTLEAEQLAAENKLHGSPDAAVVQSTLQFIDARIAAVDKSRASMAEFLKAFDGAQQIIKDHATIARTALSQQTTPPPGGSGGGNGPGGSSGTKDAPKPADGKSQPAPKQDEPPAKKGGLFGR